MWKNNRSNGSGALMPIFRPGRWGQALVLGLGASLLCWGGSANAADEITLSFQGSERVVQVGNLRRFIETGEAATEEMQSFFQQYPRLAQAVRNVLGKEIRISVNLGGRIRSGRIGEFVLLQLDKLFSRQENLADLRSALVKSFEDDQRFSLMEIMENYPQSQIYVDLNQVERVHEDVQAFVERIQPALAVVKEYLQDLVCDCPTTPSDTSSSTKTKEMTDLTDGTNACVKQQALEPSTD